MAYDAVPGPIRVLIKAYQRFATIINRCVVMIGDDTVLPRCHCIIVLFRGAAIGIALGDQYVIPAYAIDGAYPL